MACKNNIVLFQIVIKVFVIAALFIPAEARKY
jgi:hypothetical protein